MADDCSSDTGAKPEDWDIPDHKLLRRIGHGAYGEVWLARNIMGNYRAVKIVQRASFKDEVPYRREYHGIRRFEPISRTHPGFVHILHVGEAQDHRYFYYVMELADDLHCGAHVEPETYQPKILERAVKIQGHFSPSTVVSIALSLSDALRRLHDEGLVHRDIKPANIVFIGSVPKLADIGLVTGADEARTWVGTEGFIPPEGPGTPTADIYALGKVLYEAATGLDRNCFPEPPSFLTDDPEQERFFEINEILLKACHKLAASRHVDAQQLHAEFVMLENGKSVIRLRELERKWGRFKRLALAALVVGGVGVVAYTMANREWQRTEADRQRRAGFRLATGLRAVNEGDYVKALQETAGVMSILKSETSTQRNRLRYGAILGQTPKLVLLEALNSEINWCQFTLGDTMLALGLGDGRVQLRDALTGQLQRELRGHSNGVFAVATSPDGRQIATAGQDNTARLWNVATGESEHVLGHSQIVTAVDYHPKEPQLVTSCADGLLQLWDPQRGTLIREIGSHTRRSDSVKFSPDGRILASAGRDHRVLLWNDLGEDATRASLQHAKVVFHIAFSPDGKLLATACDDGKAYVWSLETLQWAIPPVSHQRSVRHVEFSPDGRYLLTSGWDHTVSVWQLTQGGDRLEPLLPHSAAVMCASFSNDGRRIVSGCADGSLRIWDQAGKALPQPLECLAISPDSTRSLCHHPKGIEIRRRDRPESSPVPIDLEANKLLQATFGPGGRHIVTTLETRPSAPKGPNFLARVWDAHSGKPLSPAVPIAQSESKAILNVSGSLLAVWEGCKLHVINVLSGQPAFQALSEPADIRNALFSPDNRHVAVASDMRVKVLETRTGQSTYPPLKHEVQAYRMVFSPNSECLAVCTRNTSLSSSYAQVWNVRTGHPIGGKLRHSDGVRDAAWSRDSKMLVTAGEDGSGKIWRVQGSQRVGEELRHRNQIYDVEIEPTSGLILTASWDRTARVWELESGLALTPPLRFSWDLRSAQFTTSKEGLLAQEFGGDWWEFPLPSATQPVPVLQRLADSYGGKLPGTSSLGAFDTAEALAKEWRELKRTCPDTFAVDSRASAAWHRFEAELCRTAKHRTGEIFHLERALQSDPIDARSTRRLQQIRPGTR